MPSLLNPILSGFTSKKISYSECARSRRSYNELQSFQDSFFFFFLEKLEITFALPLFFQIRTVKCQWSNVADRTFALSGFAPSIGQCFMDT